MSLACQPHGLQDPVLSARSFFTRVEWIHSKSYIGILYIVVTVYSTIQTYEVSSSIIYDFVGAKYKKPSVHRRKCAQAMGTPSSQRVGANMCQRVWLYLLGKLVGVTDDTENDELSG